MTQIDMNALSKRIMGHPVILMILGLMMVVAFMIAASNFYGLFLPKGPHSDFVKLGGALFQVAAAILAYNLFVRYVEHQPSVRDLSPTGAFREWGYGAIVGAGVMAITIAVIAMLGDYQVIGHNGPRVLVAAAGMAIASGFTEEILIRGIIFRFLEKWLGSFAALALSALLFGALHLANPNATWLAAFAIALEAGILLAAIYMVTRRLWAAIGLHMAWNFTQGGIFGVAVSGGNFQGLLISKMPGNPLITGGAFGAEASVPAMIICTATGVYFLWRAWGAGQFINPSWDRFKTGADKAHLAR